MTSDDTPTAARTREAQDDGLDLDAVEAEFLQQCGPCDVGLPMSCACPTRDYRGTMSALVEELRLARAAREDVADRIQQARADALDEAASDPALRLGGHSGVSVRGLRARAAAIRDGEA